MTRRAAGRADGRPRALAAAGTTPAGTAPGRAVRRGATRALLLGGLVAACAGLLSPATAVAAPGPEGAVTTAADDRPLQITLGRLEPRTVTPGAVIEVGGTLRNDGAEPVTGLSVRVQRGEVLTTRAALADDVAAPGDASAVAAPFRDLGLTLAPGESQPFTYTTTAEELQLSADGVYPVLLNVNGTRGDQVTERVGELATHLVVRAAPVAPTSVAWLWPITDRPHRDATGAFTDDELAAEVAEGGRLDRALRVLEQLPRLPGDTGAAVPVTLAVDPALLEELSVMAAGSYTAGGEAGTGTADAADALERLTRLAVDHPVVALPYADVDADALLATDRAVVLTRSLPGTDAGTARQPVAGDGTAVPMTTDAPGPADPGTDPAGGAGAQVVRDVLGVQPRTDLAWPAGGAVRADTLDTLQAGGVGTVVLGEEALTGGSALVGADGGPAGTHTTVPAAAGEVTALVADGRLAADVADAAMGTAASGRLAEQGYLAELGALSSQLAAAGGTGQTVLVVPPRRVDPDPATVAAMMADTAGQPWLAAVPVGALDGTPVAAAGALDPLAVTPSPLPAAGMAEIAATSRIRDDFAGAVVGDPDAVLAGYDAAIARAASVHWRSDPPGFDASVTALRETVARLRDQVTLLAPVDGTYSLASSDAPLVLTVQNDLPFAVQVRVDLRTRDNVGLTTDDIGVTTLEPGSRTPLQVPAHVRQSGGFAVTAGLTTPTGGALGETVQIQVKSTAYGSITLAITIGAAALLGLLFLRRAVRFVLDRRRGRTEDDGPPLDDPTALPPARSPV